MANYFDRARAALVRLTEAARDRAAAEARIAATFQAAADKAEREVSRARKANAAAREAELGALADAHAAAAKEIAGRADADLYAANRARDGKRADLVARYTAAREKAEAEYKDRLWQLASVLEGREKRAADQLDALRRKAAAGREQADGLWAAADPLLARCGATRADVVYLGEPIRPAGDDDPMAAMQKALAAAEDAAGRLRRLFLPKLTTLFGLMLFVGLAAGAGAAVGFTQLDDLLTAVGVAVAAGLVVGLGLWLVVRWLARRQTLRAGAALGEKLAAAVAAAAHLEDHAAAEHAAELRRVRDRHARHTAETEAYYQPLFAVQTEQYEASIERLVADHAAATGAVQKRRADELEAAETDYQARRAEIEGRLDAELRAAEAVYADKTAAAAAARDADWRAMADAWRTATAEVTAELNFLRAEDDRLFPDWGELDRGDRPVPAEVPGGVWYGYHALVPEAVPDVVSADPRLAPPADLAGPVPAFLPFPDRCAVVLKARDDGRARAVETLQAMMLRFVTGLPPGKVRFTIIDPVGLGENFAAFMHLADYDEKLVTGQIWTEPRQIEARLTDLTDHIASVIQKYLRNQYATIEEYNRAAGEVAEPYRVLVVANFPANFTPEAAKRLVSIAQSGPACGVCTLVGVDAKAEMPRDFRLADLEGPGFVLNWRDGRFTPKDPALAPFPLSVDHPPEPATVAALVQRVGKASKESVRVEVPFEYIAPRPDEVWRASAAKGFEVPVGRAGATRRQVFGLGRGTAQHALVAGKTGSGKSTLLHALITNLALNYSPEEAELYLIDFKEGVEFQWYAEYRLPHARVVAIQSEREFGLSVLQRLDGILRERGEKFRDAGVNDLASYRAARPDEVTPRILLVVDEFQQFFVEDDKLAQEASLLLDRLVRQGRAFGLHVLLGSQTLGGAYSLARSTIDQMAVRVALQCSDADAQLILSKDNTAARLLSRPGEAIYNDQNGLVEGNDPFQVVWLSDEKREELLKGLGGRADGKYPPPLVFEGNRPADPAANPMLARALEQPGAVKAPVAWLGDPVAIKEPTAAVFRPIGAANLLLIGQNEEAARGLFAAAMIGLAAQVAAPSGRTAGVSRPVEELPDHRPADAGRSPERDGVGSGPPSFTLLDGTPDDADDADYLRRAVGRLPHPKAAPDRAGLSAALAELAAEVDRRQKGEAADRSPRFLFVFGVHRFRELRKADDDYGFGRRGADREPSPAERFAAVLRDGPAQGVHTVVWCDSLTNLNRTFDRPLVREFGMRVLFAMSPTDSSTLIDSPAAAKLVRNRALFVQEEQDRPEKFRPYGPPPADWLDRAAEQLRAGVGAEATSV
jgi:energy-coupling factor transporter ATP-binding protein EcfA2